jgi:hypothetical protein
MTTLLPRHFCWSRFGTEAGESIDQILERKEVERDRNRGVFLWGIGNALGPSMRELLRRERTPEVIFSPISSAPRASDVSPSTTVTWNGARDLTGLPAVLPRWSTVTSRGVSGPGAQRHYALVCYSRERLRIGPSPADISMGSVQNLLTSRRVGASQVTAIVKLVDGFLPKGCFYPVAMRVGLVAPYFLSLTDPTPVPRHSPGASGLQIDTA